MKAKGNINGLVNTEREASKQYYRGQLSKVVIGEYIQVKFNSEGGNTNYMNINKDSIEVVIE